MHDVRELLDLSTKATAALARRGFDISLDELAAAHRRRTDREDRVARLRADLKRAAAAGARRTATGSADAADRDSARRLREAVRAAEADARSASEELTELLLAIPNLPSEEAPDGRSETEAVEVRTGGPPPVPADDARHHATVGTATGVFDAAAAAKLSGARFSVARGAGARLERALVEFLLDLHTGEHGYVEYSVPYLVTRKTMTGTGQLPKFEADLFATQVGDREMFLIPTAEVPLTNLFAGEVVSPRQLPLALTARSACFRAEAGSYGKDTRGVLRLHQFEKVELVRICLLDETRDELDVMVGHVEECLRRLGLTYRVMLLAAGDLGFSARLTFDVEVWLPGSGAFREISSVSDCGAFQARRAGIRVQGRDGRRVPAATLNGSALPVGRTLAALLEQGRQADGSVLLPEALVPYAGFRRIRPGGTTSD
ncbi:seryl-tRNA synthetase [Parafrankia sp. EAN1pec]|uniref:serine--tRNA ligase n=1 Tax=Parafrankia sp. (strain EAN1pec) TaxID=298653 RepID=UPI000054445D|nr:seryl-tRNA synthetase [Frankia sp. EAN1pec]